MTDIALQVKDDILDAIANKSLVLPTLPEMALQVREEAESPNVTVDSFTKILSHDVALTARVIQVANSPLLRPPYPAETLKAAVSRLGVSYSCNLATGLAMEQMFQATTDIVDKKMRELWSHSADVASISHVLAVNYTNLSPDKATLAGLIHKIGVLPILSYAEEHSDLLNNSMILDKVVDKIHPYIGNKILQAWEFPEELCNIPTQHLNFRAIKNEADYADIVMVANLQSYLGTNHPITKVDWSEIKAFERLGLDPYFEACNAEDLSADMEAAMNLLK